MTTQFPREGPVTQPLRVLHVPGDHAYVRHLQPDSGTGSAFLTVPDPTPPPTPGAWRPSVVLDPAWLVAHAGTFEVVHLHFGYEHLSPGELAEWAAAVHRAGAALVVTVHDVDNPHLPEQGGHHANLRAVLTAADRIVTLTPGAAALVRERWGRDAVVIPHPHLLPLELIGTRAEPRSLLAPRVGVPLGNLRANVDADAVLAWLTGWPGPPPVLRLSGQVFQPVTGDGSTERQALLSTLRTGADRGNWLLEVVEPGVPDEQIWRWLSSVDALVLPYRWGTHSGWVEAAADVGTSVIAPELGCWAEQRPVLGVPRFRDASAGDAAALLQRLRDPADRAGGGLPAPSPGERAAERVRIHRRHAEVYASAVIGRGR